MKDLRGLTDLTVHDVHRIRDATTSNTQAWCHQQSEVNYLPRFEKGGFPCILDSQSSVFRENRPSRERRNSSLLVGGGGEGWWKPGVVAGTRVRVVLSAMG
jgi:hypothetical protein